MHIAVRTARCRENSVFPFVVRMTTLVGCVFNGERSEEEGKETNNTKHRIEKQKCSMCIRVYSKYRNVHKFFDRCFLFL